MTMYYDSFAALRRNRPGLLPGLTRILRWMLEAYRRHRRLQRSLRAVAHLDARLLKDIGLTPREPWIAELSSIDLINRYR